MNIAILYLDALHPSGYPRDARWLGGSLVRLGASVTLVSRTGEGTDGLDGVDMATPAELLEVSEASDIVHVWGLLAVDQLQALAHARQLRERKPIVVSPLAQLMDAHLRFKAWKKRPFFAALKLALGRWPHAAHFFDPQETRESMSLLRPSSHFEASLGIFEAEGPEAGPPTRDFFLFFGRNDVRQKGLDLLLAGYRKALDRGISYPLVLAGQAYGDSDDYLRQALKRYRLHQHVELRGQVGDDEKRALLFNARCLVYLSRWDGPPRPIREAIATGTPSIVTPGTNMGELIRTAQAGYCVKPLAGDIAGAMEDACSPDKLQRWTHGVKELAGRLSWDHVANDYLGGYEGVLAESTTAVSRRS